MYLRNRTICKHDKYKSLCADCNKCIHESYKKQCKYCIGLINDRDICFWLNPGRKSIRDKIKSINKTINKKLKTNKKFQQIACNL